MKKRRGTKATWHDYEREKQKLPPGLTQKQYEEEIRKICNRLNL